MGWWNRLQSGLQRTPPVRKERVRMGHPAFENLRVVLEAGGSGLDRVVNTTVLVTDVSYFGEVNALFAEFFAASPSARMTMQVPLPKGLLFSIGCVAAVGE